LPAELFNFARLQTADAGDVVETDDDALKQFLRMIQALAKRCGLSAETTAMRALTGFGADRRGFTSLVLIPRGTYTWPPAIQGLLGVLRLGQPVSARARCK